MIKLFTFFTILFATLQMNAQSSLNAELIRKFDENSLDEEVLNVLLLKEKRMDLNLSELVDVKIKYSYGDLFSITGSVKSLKKVARMKGILRMEYTQHHLQLLMDTAYVRNRVLNVKTGMAPLIQPYDGSGIIMGIIDAGTDITHPDFKDSLGKSRINFLWDMIQPVAPNTPFLGYGQEWSNTDIDAGICTHTTDVAYWGHGTASSGIAAGNGYSVGHFEGIAPKANIMVVALDFNRVGYPILDGIQYLINKAQQLGKPISINISVGDYYGSHDGTDLQSQLINNMVTSSPGRVITAAAGNAGNVAFHVGYNTTALDTNFTWIKRSSGVIDVSEYADTTQFRNVKYTIGVNNSSFTDLGNIGFKDFNYALYTLKRDTIYHNSQRIGIVETVASINTFGVYELSFRIRPDSSNYYWRIEHNGPGRVDSWNFDYVTTGLPTQAVYSRMNKFKKADTLQTMVSGFQCSNEIITVANYTNRNEWIDVNNNVQMNSDIPGSIAPTSSFGPSRDGKVKPDISATGNGMFTTMAMPLQANYITNAPSAVAQGGYHFKVGGTSAASPVVAGLAALYLQKNPNATNQQIRQAIINCAYTDGFTGTTPNSRWGNGKLDGFAAMTCSVMPTGLNNLSGNEGLQVIPNPFSEETKVMFSNDNEKILKLYDSTGRLVLSAKSREKEFIIKKQGLSSGLYMLICEEKNSHYQLKLLIL